MEVQVFGHKKDSETRKALRFFAERRVKTHFVDFAERAASLGELKRFAQKFGVQALVDREGKRFAELGLRSALYGDEPRVPQVPVPLRRVEGEARHPVVDADQEEQRADEAERADERRVAQPPLREPARAHRVADRYVQQGEDQQQLDERERAGDDAEGDAERGHACNTLRE